ncbi:zinc finger protein RFP-like [Alligator sinensis]|uniref:Zinc finger protein RFP-like n=1 Tax=Alligator sinensis TaxID=38654 RepID=A0A3Q0FYX4_ALLSI|nr:zinc finger protein RFP-like [Alligator sinensis]
MAAASAVQSLRDEATCSVCLELFRDPVMIVGCGHNFCRACIAQCWEGAETDVTCPQCRQTFAQRLLGPNRQLANVVEVVKGLSVGSAEGAGGKMVCEQHGEALKLFCETDQVLMCVICRESRAHRAHPAAPIQEAAQQCKPLLLSGPQAAAQFTHACVWGCFAAVSPLLHLSSSLSAAEESGHYFASGSETRALWHTYALLYICNVLRTLLLDKAHTIRVTRAPNSLSSECGC